MATLMPTMASAVSLFEDNPLISFVERLHLAYSKNPVDSRWLPELTGLPDSHQVALLTQHMIDIMMKEQDTQCTSIDMNLRMMIFQHFVIYQHMLNAQHVYFNRQTAHQWAHVLAMILKESSGDSTNITDMCGYSISTNDARANLQQWKQILRLSSQSQIELNYQTNFGLTQTSSDRLFDAFHLTQNQKHDTVFLEGKENTFTSEQQHLNTAIVIRRLIWFYQGFAEGRVFESQRPLSQDEINNPEFSSRYHDGIEMALLYCGTRFMFRGVDQNSPGQESLDLNNAMASIAYCKIGNQKIGYGENEVDEQCFAEWVTLCPALNVDIATLTPLSYFATRGAKPVCEETFNRLINTKPSHEQGGKGLFLHFFDGFKKVK